jgi:2,5-diketo-D-gluconate reductase A
MSVEDRTLAPAVNQVELHPLLQQRELREACAAHGIVVQAYTSLGMANEDLIAHATVVDIAQEHGRTPAQVLEGTSVPDVA